MRLRCGLPLPFTRARSRLNPNGPVFAEGRDGGYRNGERMPSVLARDAGIPRSER